MGNGQQGNDQKVSYSYSFRGKSMSILFPNMAVQKQVKIENINDTFTKILSETTLDKNKFTLLNLKQKQALIQLHYQALLEKNSKLFSLNQHSDLMQHVKFYDYIHGILNESDEIIINQSMNQIMSILRNQLDFFLSEKIGRNAIDKIFILLQCYKEIVEFILDEQELKYLIQKLLIVLKKQNQQISAIVISIFEQICWKQKSGVQILTLLIQQNFSTEFILQPLLFMLETSIDSYLILSLLSFINNFTELSDQDRRLQMQQQLLVYGVEYVFSDLKKKIQNHEITIDNSLLQLLGLQVEIETVCLQILENIAIFEKLLDNQKPDSRQSISQFRHSIQANRISVGNLFLQQIYLPEQFIENLQLLCDNMKDDQIFDITIHQLQQFLLHTEQYGVNIITLILQHIVKHSVVHQTNTTSLQEQYHSQKIALENEISQLTEQIKRHSQMLNELTIVKNYILQIKDAIMNEGYEAQKNELRNNSDLNQLSETLSCSQSIQMIQYKSLSDSQLQHSIPTYNPILTASTPCAKSVPPPPPPPMSLKQLPQQKRRQRVESKIPLTSVGITQVNQHVSQFFSHMDDSKIQLNFNQLEELFIAKKKDISEPSKSPVQPKAAEQLRIFNQDRSRNIELVLVKIKQPRKDILERIDNMEYQQLSFEVLESLLQILPNGQETEQLQKVASQDGLSIPEQFLHSLLKIKNYEEKLQILRIILQPEQIEISNKLQKLQQAIQSINAHSNLSKLLCYILAGVNYLNSSYQKDSYGFKISEFQKIAQIKSSQNAKITLLNQIILMAEQLEGELIDDSFDKQQFQPLQKISIKNLKTEIDLIEKDNLLLSQCKLESIKEFILRYNEKLNLMKKNYDKVKLLYDKICQNFCEDPKKMDSDEFFSKFSGMITMIIETKQQIVLREEQDQRKLVLESIQNKNLKIETIEKQRETKTLENLIDKIQFRKSYKQQVQDIKQRSLKSLIALKRKMKQQDLH